MSSPTRNKMPLGHCHPFLCPLSRKGDCNYCNFFNNGECHDNGTDYGKEVKDEKRVDTSLNSVAQRGIRCSKRR
jgi:hypothetical protein